MSQEIDHGIKWDLGTYRQNIPYLGRYLSTLLSSLGRSERRVAIARYVEGLLLPGRRKFIRPLAERLNVDPQSLQQAVAHSPWDDQQVWSTIRCQVIPLLEPLHFSVLHERAWIRQGESSVGVSNQRCGANGKKARCQVSIEVLLSDGVIAAPAAGRLYLPETWTADNSRREVADIPDHVSFASKPALAIELLKEISRDGLNPGVVLADSVYGNDQDFRSALIRLGLEFFAEIDPAANMAWDFNATSPRDISGMQPGPFPLESIIQSIDGSEWKHCTWVTADGMPRHTRLAIREVFLDSTYRIQGQLQKLWLIADWPADHAKPYRVFIGHFHKRPSEIKCLRLSRHRAGLDHYQRCFEGDLDLTCYQGRSWKGFHHHLVLSAAAYLFVLIVGLRSRRGFWPDLVGNTPLDPALAAEAARLASVLFRCGSTPNDVPPLITDDPIKRRTAVNGYAKAATQL
ncbi:MAG TPA: IS701 family transposase [Candidatus Limnocylindrales bacterium]|nr:IS701 family transposase [Candidatus Limnocylindrales bacterium]